MTLKSSVIFKTTWLAPFKYCKLCTCTYGVGQHNVFPDDIMLHCGKSWLRYKCKGISVVAPSLCQHGWVQINGRTALSTNVSLNANLSKRILKLHHTMIFYTLVCFQLCVNSLCVAVSWFNMTTPLCIKPAWLAYTQISDHNLCPASHLLYSLLTW